MKKRDIKKVSEFAPLCRWRVFHVLTSLFTQKYKAEQYASDEDDDDFDKLDSDDSQQEASDDDDDYSREKPKAKKAKAKKQKAVKIGKKRNYDDARKFVELEAESSDEEEEEFQRDKKFQYYKPGELAQKTKQFDLQDLEERARLAAE